MSEPLLRLHHQLECLEIYAGLYLASLCIAGLFVVIYTWIKDVKRGDS